MTAQSRLPGHRRSSAWHHSEVRRRQLAPVDPQPPSFAPTELALRVEDDDEPPTLLRQAPAHAAPSLPRAVSEAVAVAAGAAVSSVQRPAGTPRWVMPAFLVAMAVLGAILGAVAAQIV